MSANIFTIVLLYRWEFMSTDHDIGYGWFYKQENKKEEVELVSIIIL